MRTKIQLALLLFCLSITLHAQYANSKLDIRLHNRIASGKIYNRNIHLLVKGDLAKIKTLTQSLGGIYKYGVGHVASIQIPEKNLMEFSKNPAVEKIENTNAHGVTLMDTARIRNNIDSAYFGFAPLTDSLTGKNVIIGIIDDGVYWRHPDFYDANGMTRFKYIWDQSDTGGANPPLGYGYGNEYSSNDINNNQCQEVDPANDFGHGTIVTGIACSNSFSLNGTSRAGSLRGAAPESQIIFVKLDPTGDIMVNVPDAVNYIFQKAAALCLPAVVNTSVGTYYGSHDGIDLASELIDSFITMRNDSFNCENLGRVVVAAGGNGGNIRYHISYTLNPDSTNPGYTYYSYSNSPPVFQGFYFDFWADTANFNNAWFTIGASDTFGNINYGDIGYLNIPTEFPGLLPDSVAYRSFQINYGNNTVAQPQMQVTLDEGRYHIEFEDVVASPAVYLRFQTYGAGVFDGWTSSNPEVGLYSCDMVDSLSHVFISDPNYHHPDSLKTIVSSWQCSDDVITVGNYSNRAGYLNADSVFVDLRLPANGGEVVGRIFSTSSIGPTRDGRIKPDVVATGSTTVCTGDSTYIAGLLGSNHPNGVYISKVDVRDGGTSMSSPLTAGVAALYLEKRPTAPFSEVKTALICTAMTDSATGPTPNNTYGHGKINAFQALTRSTCITYGAMDTACINYNALANVDTGGCVPKIYGCMDSTAINYNPLANVSNGKCTYPAGIKNLNSQGISIQVVPNPFSNQTTFSITNNGYAFGQGEIDIVDQLGQQIDLIPVSPNSNNYVYHNNKLSGGIYFYRLKLDGKITGEGKMVVE